MDAPCIAFSSKFVIALQCSPIEFGLNVFGVGCREAGRQMDNCSRLAQPRSFSSLEIGIAFGESAGCKLLGLPRIFRPRASFPNRLAFPVPGHERAKRRRYRLAEVVCPVPILAEIGHEPHGFVPPVCTTGSSQPSDFTDFSALLKRWLEVALPRGFEPLLPT